MIYQAWWNNDYLGVFKAKPGEAIGVAWRRAYTLGVNVNPVTREDRGGKIKLHSLSRVSKRSVREYKRRAAIEIARVIMGERAIMGGL
jgi:hypothetical protein